MQAGWRRPPRPALSMLASALLKRRPLLLDAQFVADGVFFAELNEMLTRELAEDGFSGVEVRTTPLRTEIVIRATRTQNVLGTCAPGQRPLHPEACDLPPALRPRVLAL